MNDNLQPVTEDSSDDSQDNTSVDPVREQTSQANVSSGEVGINNLSTDSNSIMFEKTSGESEKGIETFTETVEDTEEDTESFMNDTAI